MNSTSEAKIELRQREPADIPTLHDILTAVFTKTGYPVDGPSCFDAFLNPPPDEVLHAITAVLFPPTEPQDGDVEPQIVGHAMIMSPTAGGSGLNLASRCHLEAGGTMTDHAVLSRFFVNPAAQARGIGSRLLEEAVSWGQRQGKRLVLVVLDKDVAAIRLYDRAGWVRVGQDVFTSKWGTGYGAMAYLGPPAQRE